MTDKKHQPAEAKHQRETSCYAFDSAPHDKEKSFLAWHVVWKCWMPIRRARVSKKVKMDHDLKWIDGTMSTMWPSEAFSHWMPMIDRPSKLILA